MMNRWYPPLKPAEKPALLAAISSTWGCDDPWVAGECQRLIEIKKVTEAYARRFLEEMRRQKKPEPSS